MKVLPTLLRLMLVLSLVLNGPALAAGHSGNGGVPVAPASTSADQVLEMASGEEAPCDEAPHHGSPGDTAEGSAGTMAGIADEAGHEGASGCCDAGTCDGACPQQSSAALATGGFGDARLEPSQAFNAMAAAASGPALPHPIRPPIA